VSQQPASRTHNETKKKKSLSENGGERERKKLKLISYSNDSYTNDQFIHSLSQQIKRARREKGTTQKKKERSEREGKRERASDCENCKETGFDVSKCMHSRVRAARRVKREKKGSIKYHLKKTHHWLSEPITQ
jgi:hypothetical protein